MGGWFLDIAAEYLYRVVVSRFKIRQVRRWPVATGEIMDSDCPPVGYGCPVAEVHYKYVVDGETYTATHEKGFLFRSSGEHYTRLLAAGKQIVIRIEPDHPSV
jgi:hypothetical protein